MSSACNAASREAEQRGVREQLLNRDLVPQGRGERQREVVAPVADDARTARDRAYFHRAAGRERRNEIVVGEDRRGDALGIARDGCAQERPKRLAGFPSQERLDVHPTRDDLVADSIYELAELHLAGNEVFRGRVLHSLSVVLAGVAVARRDDNAETIVEIANERVGLTVVVMQGIDGRVQLGSEIVAGHDIARGRRAR